MGREAVPPSPPPLPPADADPPLARWDRCSPSAVDVQLTASCGAPRQSNDLEIADVDKAINM